VKNLVVKRKEEEGLFLFGVVVVRNEYGASDRITPVVLVIIGDLRLKSRSGIERSVAQEFVSVAVETVRAGLGFGFDCAGSVAAVLSAMKPDAHLVNVGRGALVDESALVSALIEGRIGGATLDVFDIEPLPIGHPLWEAPNVTITAHMSGDVVGWRDTLAAQYTENVRRWLVGEPLRNVVDKKLGYIPGPGR